MNHKKNYSFIYILTQMLDFEAFVDDDRMNQMYPKENIIVNNRQFSMIGMKNRLYLDSLLFKRYIYTYQSNNRTDKYIYT
jgi:hypothetical protein